MRSTHPATAAEPCRRRRFAWLRRPRGQRGQSLVEFAFALPIFLVVFFGIVEFGVILTDQIQLTNTARDATRAGSIHFENSPAPIPDSDRITQATTAAQSSASALISCPLQSPSVKPQTQDASPPVSPYEITVKVQCSYTPITPLGSLVTFIGGALNLPTTLSSTSTRYVEP